MNLLSLPYCHSLSSTFNPYARKSADVTKQKAKDARKVLKNDLAETLNTLTLDDFSLLSVIGKGSFAKVALVCKKDTGQLFALKITKKENLEQIKQVEYIYSERKIMASISHPFIVNMHFAFQNERKLFMGLEYCPGGELFGLLKRTKERRFTEQEYSLF